MGFVYIWGRLLNARLALIQDYQLICCFDFIYFGWTIEFRFHSLKPFCIHPKPVKKIQLFSVALWERCPQRLANPGLTLSRQNETTNILLQLTPDDFTRQMESSRLERVKLIAFWTTGPWLHASDFLFCAFAIYGSKI